MLRLRTIAFNYKRMIVLYSELAEAGDQMVEIEIPGRGPFKLENLVLDMNGTIALDGNLNQEVASKIKELASSLRIYIITAGTHGKLDRIEKSLGTTIHKIKPPREAEQKQQFVEKLGADRTLSIGNGSNDTLMLKAAAIGIAVVGTEGAATKAIFAADVVTNNIADAFELLLKPKRLIATLRK